MDKFEFESVCIAAQSLLNSGGDNGWTFADSTGPMPKNTHGIVFSRYGKVGRVSVAVSEPPNRRGFYEVELSVAPLRRGKAVVFPRDVTGSTVDIRGRCQPQTMPVFLAEQIRGLAPIANNMAPDMLAALDELHANYVRRDAVVAQLTGWGFSPGTTDSFLGSEEREASVFHLDAHGMRVAAHVPSPVGPRAVDVNNEPLQPVCTVSVSFPHEKLTDAVAKIIAVAT